ncbi:MAG: hypothetical protein AAF546_12595 [Verrucomicrobiota bacterium]
MSRAILTLLVVLASAASSLAQEKEKKIPDHALPVLQNWLYQNSEAVEVCVYREEWEAPTAKFKKGVLKRFATITCVHKGSVKVGDHVILTSPVEFAAGEWKREANLRPSRVSMVDGELMVVIFDREPTPKKGKYWDVGHDISRFKFGNYFHKAFLIEKKADPKLEGKPN